MSKFIGIVFATILGLALGLLYIAASIVSWFAALGSVLIGFIAFCHWLGWHYGHHAADWPKLVTDIEQFSVCVLIVFIVRVLPMLLMPDATAQGLKLDADFYQSQR